MVIQLFSRRDNPNPLGIKVDQFLPELYDYSVCIDRPLSLRLYGRYVCPIICGLLSKFSYDSCDVLGVPQSLW